MKKLLSLALIGALALSLTACGGSSSKDNSSTKKETTSSVKKEEKKEPLDLTETWQCDPVDGTYLKATISNNVIEIDWVFVDENKSAIYWVGSYDAPTTDVNQYKWTSNNNHEQTENSILASTDDTKEFSYNNGIISFAASMQGVSKTFELKKQ
ncbi:hypothetical protein DWX89_02870 [Coprobacillus sp. AF21-8LB]|nr:hypothetical protein DWX89_02870 [Coprobacillus sp. AF21-8LB]